MADDERERLLAQGKVPEAMALVRPSDAVFDEAMAILRDVARTRRSDAWGVVAARAQRFLDEHGGA